MRLIGTLNNENHARQFLSVLAAQNIEATCEMAFDAPTGHMSYGIWVHDEDHLADATRLFEQFQQTPEAPEFRVTTPPPKRSAAAPPPPLPRAPTPITLFLLLACVFVFFVNQFQEFSLDTKGLPPNMFRITPVQEALLFEVPPPLVALEEMIQRLPPDPQRKAVPPDVAEQIVQAQRAPYWRGAYDILLRKAKGEETAPAKGPLFEQIRSGQVWRLFSPALLHHDFLHILFNMIWLYVLGRPIEERLGGVKTMLLTLILGVGSNVAQYLMGGPFFLGYSGIVLGLAGFTWSRERLAPWEGYPLNRPTIWFLALFVLAMAALQLGSFLLLLFTRIEFSPNIANTAHIAGALFGLALGRLKFFAWRVKKS